MSLLVCPTCRKSEGLWAQATFVGWHSIDATVDPDGSVSLAFAKHGHPYSEVNTSDTDQLDGYEMGCSCGWEGNQHGLVQLGIDGEPLPKMLPGQESLPV